MLIVDGITLRTETAVALTRVGAASTHTQVPVDQKPRGYVSFDSGVLLVLVTIEVLHADGAAVVVALARIGAASTHTQVQWDQMPRGYVSFDSGVMLVLVFLKSLMMTVR